MIVQGLNQYELKDFGEMRIKANDQQLLLMISFLQKEFVERQVRKEIMIENDC